MKFDIKSLFVINNVKILINCFSHHEVNVGDSLFRGYRILVLRITNVPSTTDQWVA